jgi:uncharacterized protein (TIGR00375 family)
MKIISDLHIHGRYSRATSKALTIPNLEKYARIKGVTLMGTGDFTHPKWNNELKQELTEDGTGILKTKSGFPFMLSSELSLIYSQDKKGRKVHNVILAPDFETVEQINAALLKKGRLDYDGRPIFGMSCIEFVEMMKSINDKIEIIPAHIWTPWFSLFGSMSGFDSIKDCFQDQLKHIHALETGLSSDPAMNWRLSQLDKYSLVSFSDLHSFWPWRIGREATVFDLKKLTYNNIIGALKTKEGLDSTIEFWPHEGKYHFDGHRNCNIVMSPKEALKHKNICPVCGKQLTIGVAHRVEELADRDEGFKPKDGVPFKNLIPLSELISGVMKSAVASKTVWKEYNHLIEIFDNELNILQNTLEDELRNATDEKITGAIIKNREEKIEMLPGYDGVYGKAIFYPEDRMHKIDISTPKEKQMGLGDY